VEFYKVVKLFKNLNQFYLKAQRCSKGIDYRLSDLHMTHLTLCLAVNDF